MGLSVPGSVQIESAVLLATVEVLLRSNIKENGAVRDRHTRCSNRKYKAAGEQNLHSAHLEQIQESSLLVST